MEDELHIGHEIARVAHDRGLTPAMLADRLGLTAAQVARVIDRPAIDADLLLRVSRLLDHNFFALLQQELRRQRQQPQ